MTDTTYNGWSNRATWNVKLWLDNEESTYREVQNLQRNADDKPELAQQLRELCYAIWPSKQTPDGDPLSECDWDEIAENTWEDDDHEEEPPLVRGGPGVVSHFDTHDYDDNLSACKRCGQNAQECGEQDCEGTEESTPSPESETIPLKKFIEDHAIRMEAHRIPARPDGLMKDSARDFRCILTMNKKRMGIYFSQGSAYVNLPTAEDVLDSLASDASSYMNDKPISFEEWARNYGYDQDSRSAEKIFKSVKRQSEQLKRFLGAEAFEVLLNKVERL